MSHNLESVTVYEIHNRFCGEDGHLCQGHKIINERSAREAFAESSASPSIQEPVSTGYVSDRPIDGPTCSACGSVISGDKCPSCGKPAPEPAASPAGELEQRPSLELIQRAARYCYESNLPWTDEQVAAFATSELRRLLTSLRNEDCKLCAEGVEFVELLNMGVHRRYRESDGLDEVIPCRALRFRRMLKEV